MTTPYPSIANADNFRWETGVTPLGNVKTIVITLTCAWCGPQRCGCTP